MRIGEGKGGGTAQREEYRRGDVMCEVLDEVDGLEKLSAERDVCIQSPGDSGSVSSFGGGVGRGGVCGKLDS